MHNQLPPELNEALRLTLGGDPGQATAAIQRMLGRVEPSGVRQRENLADHRTVEAEYHVVSVDDTPTETAAASAAPRLPAAVPAVDMPGSASLPGRSAPVGAGPDPDRKERTAATLAEALSVIQQTLDGALPKLTLPAVRLPSGATAAPRRPAGAVRTRTAPGAHIQPAGQFVTGSYTSHAGTRTYKLYIPTGYVGQSLPLVVMLHGCTQSADDIAAGTRLNHLAEQNPHFIVYPEQTASANAQRCWNWFQAAHQERDEGEPMLIAGITRQVMDAYSVDRERVYIAGMSAGGAMAAIVGASYPDLYAAVGVHSGLARRAAHDLPSALAAMQRGGPDAVEANLDTPARVPLIVFHGERDTTVHPRNGQRVLAHALRPSSHESENDQRTTVDHGQVPGGRTYTRTVYQDAKARVVAEHWLVQGAGHAWSGGSTAGSFTDPRGPDASAEMLRFFREHPRGATAA